MCGFTGCQSLLNIFHSHNRRSMCMCGKNVVLVWAVPVNLCALNTGYVFMLFLPITPAVAVHWVAFVRAMVTCHIAKRSTPKHSVRDRWSMHGADEDSRTSCYTHFLSLPLSISLWAFSFFPQFTSLLTPMHHKDNPLIIGHTNMFITALGGPLYYGTFGWHCVFPAGFH